MPKLGIRSSVEFQRITAWCYGGTLESEFWIPCSRRRVLLGAEPGEESYALLPLDGAPRYSRCKPPPNPPGHCPTPAAAAAFDDFAEPSEPRDFACVAGTIWMRCIQGVRRYVGASAARGPSLRQAKTAPSSSLLCSQKSDVTALLLCAYCCGHWTGARKSHNAHIFLRSLISTCKVVIWRLLNQRSPLLPLLIWFRCRAREGLWLLGLCGLLQTKLFLFVMYSLGPMYWILPSGIGEPCFLRIIVPVDQFFCYFFFPSVLIRASRPL